MMIDWAEGHHEIKLLLADLYEAMLWGKHGEAMDACDRIIVEARLTKAMIGAQHDDE
jgi:hypothetical protein